MAKPVVRERVIEQYLYKQCKEIGAMCIKQEARYNIGIPDRLVIYSGLCVFVEVKRPGGVPTPKQFLFHDKLEKIGMKVAVIDTKEKVDIFIDVLVKQGNR